MSNKSRSRPTPNKSKASGISRRQLLAYGAMTASATYVGGYAVTRVFDARLGPWIDEKYALFESAVSPDSFTRNLDDLTTERARLIRDLFSDRGEKIKIQAGKDHFNYPGQFHPDDQLAMDTLCSYAFALSGSHELITGAPDCLPEDSIVLTGSPVSNYWTRQFLEYVFVDPSNRQLGLRRVEQPRLSLPFSYALDANTLLAHGVRDVLPVESSRPRPNWAILTPFGLLEPGGIGHARDFLLVSRLPNLLGRERKKYDDFKNTVTVFAGAHGLGTASVKILLNDLDMLRVLKEKTRELEFWQALIPIEAITMEYHPYRRNITQSAASFYASVLVDRVGV